MSPCGLNMLLLAHYTCTPEWKVAEALQLQASESMAFGKADKGHRTGEERRLSSHNHFL